MSTVAQPRLTADEFYEAAPRIGRSELLRGEVVRLTPTGGEHGLVAARIVARLALHADARGLGYVFSSETGFVLATDPDTVRAPDAAFVSHQRLAGQPPPREFVPFAPDLAVEVVSPNDRPKQIEAKVRDYLTAGSRRVWVVYPSSTTMHVYDSAGSVRILHRGEVLTDDELLPGFSCSVGELFRR